MTCPHLWIVSVAGGVAIVTGVPLGIAITQSRRTADTVLYLVRSCDDPVHERAMHLVGIRAHRSGARRRLRRLIALAQAGAAPDQPSVVALLAKWTPLLAQGFLFNLLISIGAMAAGTLAGVLLGFARISFSKPVRGASWIVVQFFRNSPWLVLLFFVMYLFPFEFRVGGTTIAFPDWIMATPGLALPIMANVAEIVRGAVQSIPTAQWDAARSLAFTRAQTLWKVTLPQCVKRMLPPWMNWYAILTMATTLASIVGVSEVMAITLRITNAEGRTDLLIPIYSYVLLWFFVYCYPISVWTRRLEARYEVR